MTDQDLRMQEGDCLFCKIVSGEIETPGIFWENDKYMAFLSIFPNTEGFSVVIPKKHWGSDVLALPDDELQRLVLAAKEASLVLMGVFDDVGRVGLIMEGMGVDHAHIKLSPMHGTEHLKRGVWKEHASGLDQYFDKYEGYISSANGPKASDEGIMNLAKKLRAVSGYQK